MNINGSLLSFLVFIFVLASCGKGVSPTPTPAVNPNLAVIETALDSFANRLASDPPTHTNLGGKIYIYLNSHPAFFYGSTVTLLDSNGKAIFSPYYYRNNGDIDSVSLMDSSYHIDNQDWLRQPIDLGYSIWTAPYFDAGGGEIWMRTRSVPIFINGKIFAVATTDLQVDKP